MLPSPPGGTAISLPVRFLQIFPARALRLVKPLLRLLWVTQAVMAHRQEEPLVHTGAVALFLHGLRELFDGLIVLASPIQHCSQGSQVLPGRGLAARFPDEL